MHSSEMLSCDALLILLLLTCDEGTNGQTNCFDRKTLPTIERIKEETYNYEG